jgi:tripartite-type tricarboxylate transporter receptor subunit TctC
VKNRLCFAALGALLLGFTSLAAVAQTYPARTVTVVVPYPAGGSVDGVARIIAQELGISMGQNFVVENRAGGFGGIVGANFVAKSPADGYTLLLTASIHVVTPFLQKDVPYDVVKDFTPISLVASGPVLVSTTPKFPATNLKEFFDVVRKDPAKYTFATSSFGSAGHLAIELLKRDAGVDTLVIPYKGATPALTDLMAGAVQLMADPMLSSLPLAKAGNIKALAVTSLKRVAVAPEIPTVAESGMTGFDFSSWYGLWGPKSLPPELVARLRNEVAKIVERPDIKDRFAALGFDPIGSTPEYFAQYISDEMARYQKIIADAHIKAE